MQRRPERARPGDGTRSECRGAAAAACAGDRPLSRPRVSCAPAGPRRAWGPRGAALAPGGDSALQCALLSLPPLRSRRRDAPASSPRRRPRRLRAPQRPHRGQARPQRGSNADEDRVHAFIHPSSTHPSSLHPSIQSTARAGSATPLEQDQLVFCRVRTFHSHRERDHEQRIQEKEGS